jgi:hypothetical protein
MAELKESKLVWMMVQIWADLMVQEGVAMMEILKGDALVEMMVVARVCSTVNGMVVKKANKTVGY